MEELLLSATSDVIFYAIGTLEMFDSKSYWHIFLNPYFAIS